MKRRLLFLAVLAMSVAGGPACTITTGGGDEPKPRVTSITPASGPYGTTVVLHGENLDRVTLDVAGLANVTPSEHTASSIAFRFVFPAAGPIALVGTDGTRTDAGAFLGDWTPGARVARGRPLAVVQRDADTVVLTQGAVVVFDGAGAARDLDVPGMPAVVDAVAELRDGHAVFVAHDDRALYTIEVSGDQAALAKQGDLPSGDVLAVGMDHDGPVALVRFGGRYARAHAKGGTVTVESKDLAITDPKGAAFVEGGDLLVAHGRDDTPAFGDYVGIVSLARVPAADTAESEPTEIARVQDAISSVHVSRAIGGTVTIDACGLDTDPLEPSRIRCASIATDGVRTANLGSGSADVGDTVPPRAGSFAGGTVVSTACADKKLTVVTDAAAHSPAVELPIGTVVIEPCTNAGLPVLGPDGRARVLLDQEGALYLAAPR